VIQGYSGVAVVDAAHQVIIEAQAHGTGAEQELLLPLLDACADKLGEATLVTADAGYHSEANLKELAARKIDALIADPGMRKRDERYAGQEKHRQARPAARQVGQAAKRQTLWPAMTSSSREDHSHASARPGNACTATAGLHHRRLPRDQVSCSDRACSVVLRDQCLRNARRPPQPAGGRADSEQPQASHSEQMRTAHRQRRRTRQYGQTAGHRRAGLWQHPLQQGPEPLHPSRSHQGRRPVEAVRACSQHREAGEVHRQAA
jgi:hypothetical protein